MRLVRRVNLSGLICLIGAVLVWQWAAATGPFAHVESLAAPTEVVQGLSDWAREGRLRTDISHTLTVVVISSLIAMIAGTTLGLLLGLVDWFYLLTASTFDVVRTIPLVALMPVALLIWGAEARTEIIISSVAATWPMLVNAASGVRAVHPRLSEVGRMFQFSRGRTVGRLILPAAVPQLMVGARLCIVTALVAAIIAEMIISPAGLGWALIETQNALRNDQTWAVMVVCALIGCALNLILAGVVRRVHGDNLREA